MKRQTYLMAFFCCLFLNLDAQNTTADLKEMLSWFTGEFDNFQQVWQEKEDKIPDSLRHEHIHSIFMPVSMPAVGAHVFFVKQYMNGDTDNIYRMRVYNFSEDKNENAIRLDIFTFKKKSDETTYKNANLTPSVLTTLKPENFTSTTGCGVFWRKEGTAFIGSMKEKACNFISKRNGKKIFVTDSLRLTLDQIWIRDEAYDETGSYVFGHKAKIHHKLIRCRTFKGWFAIRQEGGKEEKYDFVGNLTLHDQGWRKRVIRPDGTSTPYTIELSQVVFEKRINVMKLAIYEEGTERAITYNWTNPEAERIGINLRYLQVGLTLVKDSFKNSEVKK
jgi:CpeT/CpcT family (DUF1001)